MNKFDIRRMTLMTASFAFIMMFVQCSAPDSNFVGKISNVELADNVRELDGKSLPDVPLPFPCLAIRDSLFITFSPMTNVDYHYRVYNVKTGNELGAFVACGHGESEFVSPPRITSIYVEDGDMKTLLFSPNVRKIFVWNITKSLDAGTTVFEDMVAYDNMIEDGKTFNVISKYGDNDYVVKIQSYINYPDGKAIPHHYLVVDGSSLEGKKKIDIVKKGIDNDKCQVSPDNMFSSNTRINPEIGKIVEAMLWLGQINIADIATGDVKSYRLAGTEGSEIFNGPMYDAKQHYIDVACDNEFIYALWNGKSRSEGGLAEWIHKYDWDGNMVERIHLDKQLFTIWLDDSADILYGYSPDDDRSYAYHIGA